MVYIVGRAISLYKATSAALRRTLGFSRDPNMKGVAGGAAIAFSLRMLGAAFSFGFSLLLARLVGATGAGLYYLAFTALILSTVVGRMGLDNTLLRFTAAGVDKGNWSEVAGVHRRGIWISTSASIVATALVIVFAPWISGFVFSEPSLVGPLRLMALAILPMSLLTLYSQLLKGLSKVRDALLVQGLGVPLVSFALLAGLGGALGVTGAVIAYVSATGLVLVFSVWLWRRATPQIRGVRGSFDTRLLLATSLPLFWAASMNLVMNWTDTIMLGIFMDSAAVGVYGAAMRTAALIGFILAAFSGIVAPKFAALHARNDLQALGRLARSSTRFATLIALPPLLLFALFPTQILKLFGPEFSSAAAVLVILAIGQFVNVASGLVGYLLIMCGFEKVARNNVFLGAGLNVLLNVVLIPLYGISGAAIATGTAMALRNLAAVYLVRKHLSINMWAS